MNRPVRRWLVGALTAFCLSAVGAAPPAKDGFVWLYSVTGYEKLGPKRALLRPSTTDGTSSIDLNRSRWRVADSRGAVALEGAFRALPTTFGIRLWEADFTALSAGGKYVVTALLVTTDGPALPALRTDPFDVGAYVLTGKTLAGVSYRNAELRNGTEAHGFGFYDCNSLIGEGRSHGAFLGGLVNAYVRRKDRLNADESARSAKQIRIALNYVLDLQNPQTGEFSNSSTKRRAPPEPRPIATPYAMWGLATFLGELGRSGMVDPPTVTRIVSAIQSGVGYLQTPAGRNLNQPHIAAAIAMRLFQHTREQRYADIALERSLAGFLIFDISQRGGYATDIVVPYFEALALFLREFSTHPRRAELVDRATRVARRDYAPVVSTNGFHLFPVGLPRTFRETLLDPSKVPQGSGAGNFWPNGAIARMSSDAIYLAEITGDRTLLKIAAAGLGWITGINTGVPARYTSRSASDDPDAFVAAAYIANISDTFALPWRRWFWPGDQKKVMSLVNGAVVSPERGWVYDTEYFEPSETFILTDGLYLSAMTAYEDYVNRR